MAIRLWLPIMIVACLIFGCVVFLRLGSNLVYRIVIVNETNEVLEVRDSVVYSNGSTYAPSYGSGSYRLVPFERREVAMFYELVETDATEFRLGAVTDGYAKPSFWTSFTRDQIRRISEQKIALHIRKNKGEFVFVTD